MNDKEKAVMVKRIRQWEESGKVMERLRREDLQNIDVQQVIESFDDAFESALLHTPARLTSGLVEQQAWFAKKHLLDSNAVSDFYNESSVGHPKIHTRLSLLKDTDTAILTIRQ